MFRGFSKIVFTVVRARQLYKSSYKQTTINRHIVTRLIAFSSMSKAEEKMGSEKSKNKHKSDDQDGQEKPTKERVLRSNVKDVEEETIRANRDLYLNMSLDEKRTKYKCKGKFETLGAVQSWPDYAHTVLQKKGKYVTPKKAVDKELNSKIALWRGDITTLEVDAVVNAANNSLMGGGGVDGAIHSAAGSKLLDECISLNRCDTGEAKISGGYKLPAKYIIHTVGPMGENKKKLSSCYRRCLEIAKENNLKTVAFPCISTGIYGYDVKNATPVALEAVRDWLQDKTNENTVERVIFCVFLIGDVNVYEENLLKYFPVDKDNSRGDDKGTVQTDRKKAKANGKSKTDTGTVESKTDTQNIDKDEEKAGGETKETVVIEDNGKAVAYEKKSTEVKESDIPSNDVDDSSPAAKKKPPNPDDSPAAKKKPPNPDDSPAAKKKPPNPDDKEASAGEESDGMKDKPDTDSDAKRETSELNGEKKENMSQL